MCHLSSSRFLSSFLCTFILFLIFNQSVMSQAGKSNHSEPITLPPRLQASKDDLTLMVSLAQPIEKATQANVRLVLLNPEDVVRAQLRQDVQLVRHQKQLAIRLARPFEKVPAQEMEMLHWLRVKYDVTTSDGQTLASGIEALRATTTDPFVLTAAASQLASPGLPYRVQVHVKSNSGQLLTGVQVSGNLVWDEDDGKDHKLSVMTSTGVSGNATLEFPIPREIHAEDGDLTVGVKSGLVARSLERSVDFRARSYLLLDTDKDIYQPGQTVHARTLRFDFERKAVEKEILDLRIEDQERTFMTSYQIA